MNYVALIYFRLLELLMQPIKLRAGIGIGECTVMLEGGSSTQQDGPVYHYARKAMEREKLEKEQLFVINPLYINGELVEPEVKENVMKKRLSVRMLLVVG